jgi:hypothetical protein
MLSGAFFLYSLPYFQKMPALVCQSVIDGPYDSDCDNEEACSLDPSLQFKVNYDSIDSLHNWIQ